MTAKPAQPTFPEAEPGRNIGEDALKTRDVAICRGFAGMDVIFGSSGNGGLR